MLAQVVELGPVEGNLLLPKLTSPLHSGCSRDLKNLVFPGGLAATKDDRQHQQYQRVSHAAMMSGRSVRGCHCPTREGLRVARRFSLRADQDWPRSERRVWDALAQLSEQWVVFHSVRWFDGEHNGEADFVFLHPTYGLAVVEVKGGGVHLDRGQWYTVNRHRRRSAVKSPFEQATVSSKTLLAYLKRRLPDRYLPVTHGVFFPDLSELPALGPAAGNALFQPDLLSLESALLRLMAHPEPLTVEDLETIVDLLAPTVTVEPLLASTVRAVSHHQLNLTQEQVHVLKALRRNRRFVITGGAGTGKTVLAIEQARRLAREGVKVLLTCYNEPLAQHLAGRVAGEANLRAIHFHGLVLEEMAAAGLPRPAENDNEFWNEKCPRLLMAAARKTGYRVDALVVDEAQDIAPLWWQALESLTVQPGRCYVFGDPLQNIYRDDDWTPPFDGLHYELTINCRNTRPIAEVVAALAQHPYDVLPVDGPELEYVSTQGPDELLHNLRRTLSRLADQGLEPRQVQILCQTRAQRDYLLGQTLAHVKLCGLGQEGIAVETIHRFKGLEAEVVILLQDRLKKPRDYRLANIGLSRARSHAIVLAPASVISTLQTLPRARSTGIA